MVEAKSRSASDAASCILQCCIKFSFQLALDFARKAQEMAPEPIVCLGTYLAVPDTKIPDGRSTSLRIFSLETRPERRLSAQHGLRRTTLRAECPLSGLCDGIGRQSHVAIASSTPETLHEPICSARATNEVKRVCDGGGPRDQNKGMCKKRLTGPSHGSASGTAVPAPTAATGQGKIRYAIVVCLGVLIR